MTAPVQVLVLGFEDPTFSGEVLAELTRLGEAGVVRLVDLLLVSRGEDGSFETLPAPPGADPGLGRVAAAVLGVPANETGAPEGSADTWSLEDAVPRGSTGAVALIEHLWAEPLVGSISREGGRLLAETWLPAGDVQRLGSVPA